MADNEIQRSVTEDEGEDEVAVDDRAEDLPTLLKRHSTLTADLAQAESAVVALGNEATSAFTRGDPTASTLVADATAARERAKVLDRALGVLSGLIAHAEAAERHDKGEARQVGIKRAIGSLHAAYGEAVERAQELSAELVVTIGRVHEHKSHISQLRAEALVLSEVLGLDPPDLPVEPQRPAADSRLVEAIGRVGRCTLSDLPALPSSLSSLPYRGSGWDVKRVLAVIQGTPTAELVAQVGAGLLADPEGWERRREQAMRESRDRGDAQRRAEIAKYDTFLRERLAGGPVLLTVIEREGAKAGLRRHPDSNYAHRSLDESADRLGVVGLEKERLGPVYWSLPDSWDRARFQPLSQHRATLAGMRGG
jgi:hypothetical protein